MVTYLTTGLPPFLPARPTRAWPDPAAAHRAPSHAPLLPSAAAAANLLRARPIVIALPRPYPSLPSPAGRTGLWAWVVRAVRWLIRLYRRPGSRGDCARDCALRWLRARERAERGPLRIGCWRVWQGGMVE